MRWYGDSEVHVHFSVFSLEDGALQVILVITNRWCVGGVIGCWGHGYEVNDTIATVIVTIATAVESLILARIIVSKHNLNMKYGHLLVYIIKHRGTLVIVLVTSYKF